MAFPCNSFHGGKNETLTPQGPDLLACRGSSRARPAWAARRARLRGALRLLAGLRRIRAAVPGRAGQGPLERSPKMTRKPPAANGRRFFVFI